MNSSRFKPELYRSVIHPLMSISVASTGVVATIWLVGANVGLAAPRAGTVIAIILATVLEAVAGNILFKERMGIGNRVRELAIYLAVLYGLFSVVRDGPFLDRFRPALEQIMPLLAIAFGWMVAFAFHNRLRGREHLLRVLHGAEGPELRRRVLDHQHEMALTVQQLRRARGLIGGLFVALSTLAVFATLDLLGTSVLRAGSGAFVFLVLYGISSIAAIGSLNTFIEEYAANGEGLSVPLRFQRRRSIVASAVILLVLVLAFALSRNESILPVEAIGDFFRWLASLFDREADLEMTPPQLQQGPEAEPPPSLQDLIPVEEREPPLWLRVLSRLMERLAITAAIIGGTVLIFGPLFSPAFREALKQLKPKQFIIELLRNLQRRLRVVTRLLRSRLRRRSRRGRPQEETERAPSQVWREKQWKPSLRKRRQMDRVVQVFVDITRWGRRHSISYNRTQGAREYLRMVAELYPEHYQDAVFVAQTFCEARFSRHLMPRTTMREYAQAAKRITRE